ncbi:MAG: glycosyltransferase family 39 protein [Polyangiaceae bacterium]
MPSTSVPPPAEVIPNERNLDPDLWLRVVCWLVIALSALQILLFSFGRDQSIYATVADGVLHGQMPYRDVWDFKPPGIFVVYALAQALFGKTMLAPRLLEVIGLVAGVFAMREIAYIFLGSRRVGLMGGAVAALIHAQLEFWHSGQPETFGGMLTLFALWVTARDFSRRRRYVQWTLVGVLFGAAFLLKPPLGGGAIVCAVYLAVREARRLERPVAGLIAFVSVGVASLLPLLACAAWFRARGAWPALHWTLFEFTPGYTRLGWTGRGAAEMFYWGLEEAFFRFSALAAFGCIAAIVIRPMHSREREGIFLLLGVISVHVAGIAMQGKFFQYHYAATLPLIALLAGLGLYKLWRRCLGQGLGGPFAFAAFVAVALSMRIAVRDLGSFWDRAALRTSYVLGLSNLHSRELLDKELYRVADYNLDANRLVAAEIRQRVPEGEPIYVWGFEPGLYWLSGRPASSRYIYDVPQRVRWERERARRELMQELRDRPPFLVVVQHGDRFSWVTGDDFDSAEAVATFPELESWLQAGYQKTQSIEDFDLYERRPVP